MFICMCGQVQVRGLLAKHGALLPPCGFQESSVGYQAWPKLSLPTEPSQQPKPRLVPYLKLRWAESAAEVCGLGSEVTNLCSV